MTENHPTPTPGVGDTPAQAKALRKLGFTPEEHRPELAPEAFRAAELEASSKPSSSSSSHRTLAWVLAAITLGYMLPWAVAAQRGKSNAGAIGVLNLLVGWTGIGWIIALVMACLPEGV